MIAAAFTAVYAGGGITSGFVAPISICGGIVAMALVTLGATEQPSVRMADSVEQEDQNGRGREAPGDDRTVRRWAGLNGYLVLHITRRQRSVHSADRGRLSHRCSSCVVL